MNQEQWNSQGTNYQRQTNGTGGDMPTGFRPCPFCHSVIPWDSETCPSCGRVLIERVVTTQQPTTRRIPSKPSSWWTRTVAPRLAHLYAMIRSNAMRGRFSERASATRDSWSTTTRGTSWSVFQPAGRPSRSWWPRGLPQPSDRERIVFFAAVAVMVVVFLFLLLGAKR